MTDRDLSQLEFDQKHLWHPYSNVTKPGPTYTPAEPSAGAPAPPPPEHHAAETHHEVDTDHGPDAAARLAARADAGARKPDAGAGKPDAGAGRRDAGAAAASPPPEHDENAVVRTKERLMETARQRPRIKPNWKEPIEMTFGDIRRTYRQYRKHKDFEPEVVARLNGAAVAVTGALMPIDPVGKSGRMKRFWLANRLVVMAGCVFCNPPTMGDLVYVRTRGGPLKVDREELYRSVVTARLLGRLELGPFESKDGVQYLFGLELKRRLE